MQKNSLRVAVTMASAAVKTTHCHRNEVSVIIQWKCQRNYIQQHINIFEHTSQCITKFFKYIKYIFLNFFKYFFYIFFFPSHILVYRCHWLHLFFSFSHFSFLLALAYLHPCHVFYISIRFRLRAFCMPAPVHIAEIAPRDCCSCCRRSEHFSLQIHTRHGSFSNCL